ncbi:H/ACA ribonucleoprotein complex subunit [Nanobdella aerobiophila]|uniref:H/ACA ribonucleoprotein complex subunit n=1 Tax=Nanobdella aerobiophila TaxID=2586965 RepID=A0A915SXZ6_9ARCH|nr:hypothetical protein [Nanobdella aerobiophila]BBL45425.1 H/ACA ribonucleoprotein complex subunit [Nanobdella aerobiophila]
MNKDSTTVYIGDIKNDLEELKRRGYSIKDILKKGIEFIKMEEKVPYSISELDQSIKELKNQVEMMQQFNLSVIMLNKSITRLNKTMIRMKRKKKPKEIKEKKKGLIRRLISSLVG